MAKEAEKKRPTSGESYANRVFKLSEFQSKPEPPMEESKQFVFTLNDLMKYSPKRAHQRLQKKIDAFLASYSPNNQCLSVLLRAFTKMGNFVAAEELLEIKKAQGNFRPVCSLLFNFRPHL